MCTSSTRPTGTGPTRRRANSTTCSAWARRGGPGDWRPPIVKTVAARGEGVDEVVEALEKHRAWMEERGVLAERRLARAAREVETIAVTALRERIGDLHGDRHLPTLAERIVAGELDPYRAADELVTALTQA
ncbi:hypothetical protein GCM10020256_22550 [Streptomyces thermocoprophilus]